MRYGLFTVFLFLILVPGAFALTFHDAFLDASGEITLYFDEEPVGGALTVDFQNENLSFVDLAKDTAPYDAQANWQDAFPLVSGTSITLPDANREVRWRIRLQTNSTSLASIREERVIFYRDGTIVANVSLRRLQSQQQQSDIALEKPITYRLCGFKDKEPVICSDNQVSFASNSQVNLSLPYFIDGTRVSNITSAEFNIASPVSELQNSAISADLVRALGVISPGDVAIFTGNAISIRDGDDLSQEIHRIDAVSEVTTMDEGQFDGGARLVYGNSDGVYLSSLSSVTTFVNRPTERLSPLSSLGEESLYQYPQESVVGFREVNASTNLTFGVSETWNLSTAQACSLRLGVNVEGTPGPLQINASNTSQQVSYDSSLLDNRYSATSGHGDNPQALLPMGDSVRFSNPIEEYPARQCQVSLGLASISGDTPGVELRTGEENVTLDTSRVETIPYTKRTYEEGNFTDLKKLDGEHTEEIRFTPGWDVDEQTCSIGLGVGYRGEKQPLYLHLDGERYSLDTAHLNNDSYEQFRSYSPNGADSLLSMREGDLTFRSGVTTRNAGTCRVSLGVNKKGSLDGLSLSLSRGGESASLNLSGVTQDIYAEKQYAGTDWARDDTFALGSINNPEKDNLLVRTNNLYDSVDEFGNCYVRTRMCFNGSQKQDLDIFLSGVTYTINGSEVQSCGSGYQDVYQKVSCSELENNPDMTYSCPDCDSSNHYSIAGDADSDGVSNSIFNRGDGSAEFSSNTGIDPLISIFTNRSLQEERVSANMSCSALYQNNVTLSCSGCSGTDDLFLLSENTNGSTWRGGSLTEDDVIAGITTDELGAYGMVRTPVSCSAINSPSEYRLSCPNCGSENYYTVPLYSNTTGVSEVLQDSSWNSVTGTPVFRAEGFTASTDSRASASMQCSLLENTSAFTLACENCSDIGDYAVYADMESSSLMNVIQRGRTQGVNLHYGVNSSTSLLGSTLQADSLTCNEIGDSLTFSCVNCSGGSGYRIQVMNGSSGHSKVVDDTGSRNVTSGDYRISLRSLDASGADELVVLDQGGSLRKYDTTGTEQWSLSTSADAYQFLGTADVLSGKAGEEILFANRTTVSVRDRSGTLLGRIDSSNKPQVSGDDQRILVVDGHLEYRVVDADSFEVIDVGRITDAGSSLLNIERRDIAPGVSGKEYLLYSKDVGSVYLSVLSSGFEELYTQTIDRPATSLSSRTSSPEELFVGAPSDSYRYVVSPLAGINLSIDGKTLFATDDFIGDGIQTGDVSSGLREYSGNVSPVGSGYLDIPVDITGSAGEIGVDLTYSLNSSDLLEVSSHTGLLKTRKLAAGKEYFTSGSVLNYSLGSAYSLQITNLTGLKDFFGGQGYEVYDQKGELLGTCADVDGAKAEFGAISSDGSLKGCGLDRYVDATVSHEYVLYDNATVPIILDGPQFVGKTTEDVRRYNVSVNQSYAAKTFRNITIAMDSLNRSAYTNTTLRYVSSTGEATRLSVENHSRCYLDEFRNGEYGILNSYYATQSLDGKQVAVCGELSGDIYEYHVVVDSLSGADTFSLDIAGEKNRRPSVSSVSASSPSVSWGEAFNITGEYEDLDGDHVDMVLQFLNPESNQWMNFSTKNFTDSNGNFTFANVSLNISYVGSNINYRFQLADRSSSTSDLLGRTTSSAYGITVGSVSLNASQFDTGQSRVLGTTIRNNRTGAPVDKASCEFYLRNNGEYVLVATDLTNSSGVCSHELSSSYSPGTYYFYTVASKTDYSSVQSAIVNQSFKKTPQISLSAPGTQDRSESFAISAQLEDTQGNVLEEEGETCYFYVNGSLMGSADTDASGACSLSSVSLSCSYPLQQYPVSVNLSGLSSTTYTSTEVSKNSTFDLIDNSTSVTLQAPDNQQSYDIGEEISYDAKVTDSCGNTVTTNGDFRWEYEEKATGDTSLFSSRVNGTYTLPDDLYGSVYIRASFINDSYGGEITDETLLTVEDVLNIEYNGPDEFMRNTTATHEFSARITTGNGIPINESSYNGTWSGYSCDWSISGDETDKQLGSSTTNGDGVCTITTPIQCGYDLGTYSVNVNLSGNVTPEYPIFDNNDSGIVDFYENLSMTGSEFSLANLSADRELDFGTEYNFRVNLTDVCGNNQDSLYTLDWRYESQKGNISRILGTGNNLTFTPLSYMNGNATISATMTNERYYREGVAKENVTVVKRASVENLTVPEYLAKNADNSVSCQINTPGVTDPSFYNVTIGIDGTNFSVPVNENGLATYTWDTTGYSEGQHYVTCSVSNYTTERNYLAAGTPALANATPVIPSNLVIYNNSVFMGNREYDLSKSTAENIRYPDGMTSNKIFRKSISPMFEPDTLYMGIGYATIGAAGTPFAGQERPVDGINVTANIYQGDVVETWEDGSDFGWYTNYACDWGVQDNTGNHLGEKGLTIGNSNSYVTKPVNLSGSSGVTISYYGNTASMDAPSEKGYLDFYDGNQWHTQLVSHYNDAFEKHTYSVPDAWIDPNGQNKVRFRLDGSGCGDYFYLDNITISRDTRPIDQVSCIQDISAFEDRDAASPKDLLDDYADHICIMEWKPGQIPVGQYRVKINATAPNQSGWTSETHEGIFEVGGILDVSMTEPPADDTTYWSNSTQTFTASVQDGFGRVMDSDDVRLDYYLARPNHNCNYIRDIAEVKDTSDDTFASTHTIKNIDTIIDDTYGQYDHWAIQAKAYGAYYMDHDIWTTYEPSQKNRCTRFYLDNRIFHTENTVDIKYPSRISFDEPTSAIVAPVETGEHEGKLKFACEAQTPDGDDIRYVDLRLTCDGCASIPSSAIATTDNAGVAEFYVTPDSDDYGEYYDFTCNMRYGSEGTAHGNQIIRTAETGTEFNDVLVAEQLGSGFGDVPENYTFPKVNADIYSDSSCTTRESWYKSSETNSIYLGFTAENGSEDLDSWSVSKASGSAPGGSFTGSTSGSLAPGTDTKCIQFSPDVKSNGVYEYNLEAKVTDVTGVSVTSTRSFRVDDVAPIIVNADTDKQFYQGGETVSVTVDISESTVNVDGFADMRWVRYSQDTSYNNGLTKVSQSEWTGTIPAGQTSGEFTYNVKARDLPDYESTDTFTYTVDAEDPVINTASISTGCGGTLDNYLGTDCKETADLTIDASDNMNIDTVSIRGSGGLGSLFSENNVNSVSFNDFKSINLWSENEGTYTITYEVEDYAGNLESVTRELVIKKEGPDLSSVSANKQYVTSTSEDIQVSGSVSEDSPIQIEEILVEGQTVGDCSFPTTDCTFSEIVTSTGFDEGTNVLNVTSTDNLGNPSQKSLGVTLDTIDPQVNITAPNQDAGIHDSFNLDATVIDVNRDDGAVNYSLGSCSGSLSRISVDTFRATINSEGCVSDGRHNITVSATDKAGRSGEDKVEVLVDNTPPQITVDEPSPGSVKENTIPVLMNITEINSLTASYALDGGSYTALQCSGKPSWVCNGSIDTTTENDGVHTLSVRAEDGVGNVETLSYNFKIDNNPPIISLNSIENGDGTVYNSQFGSEYYSGSITTEFTVSDQANEGDPATYSCNLEGINGSPTLVTGDTYTCEFDTTQLSDGIRNLNLSAADTLDHKASEAFTLNVDNTRPNITALNLSPRLIKTGDDQVLTLNASENLKGSCDLYLSNDGTSKGVQVAQDAVDLNQCNVSYTFDEASGQTGTRHIIASVSDQAGNTREKNVSFYLDNTEPVINYYNLTSASEPSQATNGYPGISTIDDMVWEANITEDRGPSDISRVFLQAVAGYGVIPENEVDLSYDTGNNFDITTNTSAFNASENETVFQLTVRDRAGNQIKENLTIYISNAPPVVENVTSNQSLLETNVENATITVNVTTATINISNISATIMRPDSAQDKVLFTGSDVKELGGVHRFNYSAPVAGDYDIEIRAENIANGVTFATFSDVFSAVGTTNGTLTYTPTTASVANITRNQPKSFALNISLNNTGLARMQDAEILFSTPKGISANVSDGLTYSCGTIPDKQNCSLSTAISVGQDAGTGTKSVFLIGSWSEVNGESGFISEQLQITINETKALSIENNEIVDTNLDKQTNESLGAFSVQNDGNVLLDRLEVSPLNGSITNGDLNFDFSRNNFSLGVGKKKQINVTVESAQQGEYSGYVQVKSVSNPSVSDTIYLNLTFYDRVEQNLLSPSDGFDRYRNANGGNLSLQCKVTSYYSGDNLINYSVTFTKDDLQGTSTVGSVNTSAAGEATLDDQLQSTPPGPVNYTCSAASKPSSFVKSSSFGDQSVSGILRDRLNASLQITYPSSCVNTLYWYDSSTCSQVNLSTTVRDDFGSGVSSANVKFLTNATPSGQWEEIQTCSSDGTGSCTIQWNPNVSEAGTYGLRLNVTKNQYYDPVSDSTNITVKGGTSVEILEPSAAELSFNKTYPLLLRVKDTNGDEITDSLSFNTTWELYQGGTRQATLATQNNASWTINESFQGAYLLNGTITTSNETVSALMNVSVFRDTLSANILSNRQGGVIRTAEQQGDQENVTFTVSVNDSLDDSVVSGANVSLQSRGTIMPGSCVTNASGSCHIQWNPDVNIDAGNYTMNASISRPYYNHTNSVTEQLVQVYVEPTWTSAEAFSQQITNAFSFPLTCEVVESDKLSSNPLDAFPVNFSLRKPGELAVLTLSETPYVDEKQYAWDSPDADSVEVLGTNQGLEINFTDQANVSLYEGSSPVSDLGLEVYDTAEAVFSSMPAGVSWELQGVVNGSTQTLISSNTGSSNVSGYGTGVSLDNLRLLLSTSGSKTVVLDYVDLRQTIDTATIPIGEAKQLGAEFTGSNSFIQGDFEDFAVARTPGFNSIGPVSLIPSTDYSYDGDQSLGMNISELSAGDTFGTRWTTGSAYNISEARGMGFAVKNPENLSLQAEVDVISNACSTTFNVGNVTNLLTHQDINLTEFKKNCGDTLTEIRFEFTNNASTSQSGIIYLDRVELFESVSTQDGSASIGFHPYEQGIYRFSCGISGNERYLVDESVREQSVEVVEASSAPQQGENTGGQSPASGAQASQGSVLSFELNESVVNYVVPYEGKGLLEEIGIINKLSSETTFNLTSSNGSLLGFSEDMEPSLEFTTTDSRTDFGLYLNATNVSEEVKNLTVSVTNVERSESVSMDVNLKLVNVSVVYLSPTTNQKITDLLPERDLNGSLDIELNNSGLYDNKLKNFDYSILVDDAGTVKSCLDPEFTVSNGVLAISCKAPFVGADSAKDLRARVIFGGD